MTISPDQLQFDLDAAIRHLAAHSDNGYGGAARLLRALVRQGLDQCALLPAAALVVELDQPADQVDA